MKRVVTLVAGAALGLGLMAGPALAHHDHQLHNPSGCHTIPVGHQDHGEDDPGNKFHGAAHKGAATEQNEEGQDVLGKGNSPNYVAGGACPDEA